MLRRRWLGPIAMAVIALAASCTDSSKSENHLFVEIPENKSGLHFKNVLIENDQFNIVEYLYFYNGGGVATGDVNNDGLVDVFLTSNQGPNQLYVNKGDFHFEDATQKSGIIKSGNWSTGVTMADVDGDGWLDIYVCGVGQYKQFSSRNQLWINNRNGSFTNRAKEYGIDFQGFSTMASFFDYDQDGDLDLYLLNHSVHSVRSYGRVSSRLEFDPLAGDRLFRNEQSEGKARFTDMTGPSGIYSSALGYGLGVATVDINIDGLVDIYVSNDFRENDYLYLNRGDGTFKEVSGDVLAHSSRFSMGNDVADFNNDGWPDIITTDMMPPDEKTIKNSAGEDSYEVYKYKLSYGYQVQVARNALQLNAGTGYFIDIAWLAGVAASDWSWSPLLADFDNDGNKDLFISNGILRRPNDLDYLNFILNDSARLLDDHDLYQKMPSGKVGNKIFRNRGNLTFEDVSGTWGLDAPGLSNGAAYADFDNDGDLDLIVNNLNGAAKLYRNKAQSYPGSKSVTIELVGPKGNAKGINAKVVAFAGEKRIFQEVANARGFQSSSDARIHLGLGTTQLDSILVIWPDRRYQHLSVGSLGSTVVMNYDSSAGLFDYSWLHHERPLLESFPLKESPTYRHAENEFVEFNEQGLMPHMVSTEGPPLVGADFNRDGREDFFVGGGRDQPAVLYYQHSDGNFVASNQPELAVDSTSEDTGAVVFDANHDGRLDLLVVSGGDELRDTNAYLPRLYLMDKNGILRRVRDAVPDTYLNASCVRAGDADGDGDMDLFLGGRSIPGRFGISPMSFLWMNKGDGTFADHSSELPADENGMGMITDAVWVDMNNDGRQDLLVVGEWMSPKLLIQTDSGRFIDASRQAGLDHLEGWWNALTIGDFDGDGDVDFIAGNLGLNTRLKASKQEPLELWVGDFDNNGSTEQILTYFNQGKSYPFVSRDQLVKQLPSLRKKFLRYQTYAQATIADILTDEQRNQALRKVTVELRSCYFNNRKGHFDITPLPVEAQEFPIRSFAKDDVNGDGITDLFLVGNLYATQPDFGRFDSGRGLILLGKSGGEFETLLARQSGFHAMGDTRCVISLSTSQTGRIYLVSGSSQHLQAFRKPRHP